MIKRYHVRDLPMGLYGRVYDLVEFEVLHGEPHRLYVQDHLDCNTYEIYGLDEIFNARTKLVILSKAFNIKRFVPTEKDAFKGLTKRDLKKIIKDLHERNKYDLECANKRFLAQNLEMFLSSIIVSKETSKLNLDDVQLAKDLYGVDIKMEVSSDG